jgi:hypothetical protein
MNTKQIRLTTTASTRVGENKNLGHRLQETEVRNDRTCEGQQQFNRPTDFNSSHPFSLYSHGADCIENIVSNIVFGSCFWVCRRRKLFTQQLPRNGPCNHVIILISKMLL